ncbi:unnamed protein product [Thelazia callipaeda]|uniref:NOT2_3_5 domain-containing protein n=1 Tax=Thelazia callipaeda TaxID=103827 RepID=A0A0N5D9F1_THECL|nr:unnamed protein product [Thelazia callipaeda]
MSGGGGAILADRNRLSSQSSATICRNSLIPQDNVINESEFPSLGVRSSSTSAFNSLPTTSNYSSPLPQNHPYPKDIYNVSQRAPYEKNMYAAVVAADTYRAMKNTNLMRTNDGNSLPAQNVEFHIQNEDFPALPGTVKNIPAGMLNDQFGMAGLLTFLRAIETDPAIVALALGHDLTTLGLNLNSSERNIYATFGGPWADYPCRIQDLETRVPDEYLTNVSIREKLPNIKLSKLSEDVLFYLFYNCPGEVYQVAAGSELYSRDWRFHKSQRVWLTRSQYGGVKEQTSTYEKGSYNVFDPVQWRKIPRDMTLEYKELEERPKLPQPLLQPPVQPQVAQASTTAVSQNGS